jgi:pimeloyl-ACP methyl ester carboxylesterase
MTTFVLVHGAFRGAWSWDRVAALLRARGHEVVVPTLTGMGEKAHLLSPSQNVDAYAADVIGELRCRDLRDVTLVAHSFGGFPATVAADREWERIGRLVYLDAAVPVHGQANIDTSPASTAAWLQAAGGDGWTVAPFPVEVLQVNDGDRDMVLDRLTPMPITAFVQRVSLSGGVDRILRRDFVLATGWAATPYRAQAERLADQPSWTVTTVETGHEVMLDAPKWVADFLTEEGLDVR